MRLGAESSVQGLPLSLKGNWVAMDRGSQNKGKCINYEFETMQSSHKVDLRQVTNDVLSDLVNKIKFRRNTTKFRPQKMTMAIDSCPFEPWTDLSVSLCVYDQIQTSLFLSPTFFGLFTQILPFIFMYTVYVEVHTRTCLHLHAMNYRSWIPKYKDMKSYDQWPGGRSGF